VGDLDFYGFTLSVPRRVVVQVTSTSGIEPCLELLSGFNEPAVPGGAMACLGGAVRKDLALPAGTYFVLVSDFDNNEVGGYNILLQVIEPGGAVPLSHDVPVAAAIDVVGDLDFYGFTLSVPRRVVVQVTSTSGMEPCVEVLPGISGPPVAGGATVCLGGTVRKDLELAAGTYFVAVSDFDNNETGGYNVGLQVVDPGGAVPLTPDVPVTAAIDPVGDLDPYTFTLAAPRRVVLQVNSTSGIEPCLEILSGFNEPPVSGGARACAGSPPTRGTWRPSS
jgi:hypothetical protein